ncbi:MAG: MFS transporter [Actinomycetes bacterium]
MAEVTTRTSTDTTGTTSVASATTSGPDTGPGSAVTAGGSSLWRLPDFRRLWSGFAVSAFGSEVTVLAMPLTAAVLLGASPLQMGLLTAAGTLPHLGLGLLAGVWVDRLPRRRPLLVTADLLAALVLFSVPIAYLLDVLTIPQLIGVELAVGCARVTFRPAYQAHLPDVVSADGLTAASGHLRAAESGAMLAGPGLSGALVQLLSAPVAVFADAVSFLVSAACISRVTAPERVGHEPAPRRPLSAELGEGLGLVATDARLRAIAGAAANLNLFGLVLVSLFVIYATRELGFHPWMIGAVLAAGGCGALIGALTAPRVAARLGQGRTMVLASVVFSVAIYAYPLVHGPVAAEFAILVVDELAIGTAVMLFDVNVAGFVLTAVPRSLLGRVNSSLGMITQGVKPIGALVGGALGTTIGLRPALWVAAVGATTTVLWTWFSPLRHDGPTNPTTDAGQGQR